MSRLPHDFLQTTALLNRGRFVERVNAEVSKLLESLEGMPDATGAGSLTLAFKFQSIGGEIKLSATVKSSLPQLPALSPTTFWLIDGELSVDHPTQRDLFEGPRVAVARAE